MSETFCKANPPQLRKNYDLEKRKYVIGAFVVLIAIIYSVRLFDLQINDAKYKRSADSNAFLKKTVYPSRGLIYDRNGEISWSAKWTPDEVQAIANVAGYRA